MYVNLNSDAWRIDSWFATRPLFQICGQSSSTSPNGQCCVAVWLSNNQNNFLEGQTDIFAGPSSLGECYDFDLGTLADVSDVSKLQACLYIYCSAVIRILMYCMPWFAFMASTFAVRAQCTSHLYKLSYEHHFSFNRNHATFLIICRKSFADSCALPSQALPCTIRAQTEACSIGSSSWRRAGTFSDANSANSSTVTATCREKRVPKKLKFADEETFQNVQPPGTCIRFE